MGLREPAPGEQARQRRHQPALARRVPHQRRGGEHARVRGRRSPASRASRWSRTRRRSAGSGDESRNGPARGGLTDVVPRHVFVTGGTGYLGRRLIPALLARGHEVRALVRPGSESGFPAAATSSPATRSTRRLRSAVPPADTFVQLVGTPHPSPRKARSSSRVDLASVRARPRRGRRRRVRHFVYVSVAQPAPVMQAYSPCARKARRARVAAGLARHDPAALVRAGPRTSLGGHGLTPLYWMAERLPATRDTARRLGLVTLEQMVAALIYAVESPPHATRIVEAPRHPARHVVRRTQPRSQQHHRIADRRPRARVAVGVPLVAAEHHHVARPSRDCSPATASRISPDSQVRYSRVPGMWGTPGMRPPAGISMRSITTPGMGSGSSLRTTPSPCLCVGAARSRVEAREAARGGRQLLERHLQGQGHLVQHGQRRVGRARLEVAPGGARDAGELRHLLLGQAARLPQLPDVAARRTGQVVVACPEVSAPPMHWQYCSSCWRGAAVSSSREEDEHADRGTAALITGGSRGPGRGAGRGPWPREGARVVLVARGQRSAGRGSWRRSARQGGEAHGLAADVGDKEDIHRIAGAAAALVGPDRPPGPQREHAGAHAAAPRCSTRSARTSARCSTSTWSGRSGSPRASLGGMVAARPRARPARQLGRGRDGYPGWGAYGVSKAALDHLGADLGRRAAKAPASASSPSTPGEMDTAMHAEAMPEADPRRSPIPPRWRAACWPSSAPRSDPHGPRVEPRAGRRRGRSRRRARPSRRCAGERRAPGRGRSRSGPPARTSTPRRERWPIARCATCPRCLRCRRPPGRERRGHAARLAARAHARAGRRSSCGWPGASGGRHLDRRSLFGAGDWRTRTEDRPPPPPSLPAGDPRLRHPGVRAAVPRRRGDRPTSRRAWSRSRFDRQGRRALVRALPRAAGPCSTRTCARRSPSGTCRPPTPSRPWAAELPSAGRPLTWRVLARARAGAASAWPRSPTPRASPPPATRRSTPRLPLPERFEIPRGDGGGGGARAGRAGPRASPWGPRSSARSRAPRRRAAGACRGRGRTDLRHRRQLPAARRRRPPHRRARARREPLRPAPGLRARARSCGAPSPTPSTRATSPTSSATPASSCRARSDPHEPVSRSSLGGEAA